MLTEKQGLHEGKLISRECGTKQRKYTGLLQTEWSGSRGFSGYAVVGYGYV